MKEGYKLLFTIVKKGMASKVVQASKKAGASGGTIMLGRGAMDFNSEKEIVLTYEKGNMIDDIIKAITDEANINKPGSNISFVINIKDPYSSESMEVDRMPDSQEINYDLIITIVNKGFAEEVVDAAKKMGAKGGTIIDGRGICTRENTTIMGIPIESEKEIVLTLIYRTKTEQVMSAINRAVDINKPGKGMCFALKVEKSAGICHHCE